MTTTRVDVVVVGAGAAGLAAAWRLSQRGRRVVVVDRFEAGHVRGSSHGGERILRIPYADPVHVDLVIEALDGWDRLEADVGEVLRTRNGGLDTGVDSELDALEAQCARVGIETERLGAGEASARFPWLRFRHGALLHPVGAIVDADRTLAALRHASAAAGAEILDSTPVVDVAPRPSGGVEVTWEGGSAIADVCVVTTGAWAGDGLLDRALAAAGSPVGVPPIRVTQEQVLFLEPRSDASGWPTFICREDPTTYGLVTPHGLLKVGEHHTGPEVDPDRRTFQLDATTRGRLLDWVADRLPGVLPEPVDETTCLYASAPGDLFVLDRVGPIVVGIGLSGHGFKFVPAIGTRLADLADGRVPAANPFSLDRTELPVGASGHR